MMSELRYCRTCLSSQELNPIFGEAKTSEDRSKELFLLTGVTIQFDDNLSNLICNPCNILVNYSLKLRKQSQETDKVLKTRISKIKQDLSNNDSKTIISNNVKRKETISSVEPVYIDIDYLNKCIGETIKKKTKKRPNTTKDNLKIKKVKKEKQKSEKINLQKHLNVKAPKSINKSFLVKENLEKETNIKRSKEKLLDNENESEGEYEECIENINEIDFDAASLNKDKTENEIDDKKQDKNSNNNKDVKPKRKRLSKEEIQKYLSLAVQPLPKDGPVSCSLCGARLRERRYFVGHAKTHFEAEHVCETCGKRFVNRNTLRYHQQQMHGAAPRLQCALCPFRAVHRVTIQNHTRAVHTGERPYSCDVCGDSFRVRAAIAQHMRSHFATYDVQCERCPARFRSRSELASHRNKVHLMSYTYYCYLCPGTYKAVCTVKNHLVKVHGIPRDQQPPIKCTKTRRTSTEVQHKAVT